MTELNEHSRIGIIYKIEGADMVYIGSTTQLLSDRKSSHNTQYRLWIKRDKTGYVCASYRILEKCEDWTITGVEYIITDTNKKSLYEKEQEWIDKTDCINKIQAYRSIEDLKEYKREWAMKKSRENGVQPKVIGFDNKKYQKEWAKAKRAELTQEERDKINARKRELRAIKKQSLEI
jgi:hypothetical protein